MRRKTTLQVLNEQRWTCAEGETGQFLGLPEGQPLREDVNGRHQRLLEESVLPPVAAPTLQAATVEFYEQVQIPLHQQVRIKAHLGRVWVIQFDPRYHHDPLFVMAYGWRHPKYLELAYYFCHAAISQEVAPQQRNHQAAHSIGSALVKLVQRSLLTQAEKDFYRDSMFRYLAVGLENF